MTEKRLGNTALEEGLQNSKIICNLLSIMVKCPAIDVELTQSSILEFHTYKFHVQLRFLFEINAIGFL